jgi:Predicted choline kinase involved in LPS biosynthesis
MKEPFICKEIARQLGKFHTLLSFGDLYDLDGNGNGNGNEIHNGSGDSGGGDVWTRVDEWLQVATEWYAITEKDNDDCNNISPQSQIAASLKELSQEWSWLKDELLETKHKCTTTATATATSPPCSVQILARNYCRDIVFTHMDCQSLNILLMQPKYDNNNSDNNNNSLIQLQFIDFEYAGMNPRAADIGNTFCEFCDMNNLIPDYTTEYPCNSIQDMFLQSYIAANDPALDNTLKGMTQSDRDLFLSTMRQEIGKYSLISHLGWAVWSLIQNKQSSIDFDYIRYAEIRMDGYRMFKKIFWS